MSFGLVAQISIQHRSSADLEPLLLSPPHLSKHWLRGNGYRWPSDAFATIHFRFVKNHKLFRPFFYLGALKARAWGSRQGRPTSIVIVTSKRRLKHEKQSRRAQNSALWFPNMQHYGLKIWSTMVSWPHPNYGAWKSTSLLLHTSLKMPHYSLCCQSDEGSNIYSILNITKYRL